jgi:hypothetical protein
MVCSDTQYCDWMNNRCGSGGAIITSMCMTRPQGCGADYAPVCGCDRQVYSNQCMAAVAGQDLDDAGACTPPPNTFPCGPRFCTRGTQFCDETLFNVPGGAAGSYMCRELPAACGSSPTCACLSGTGACGNCYLSNDGDLKTACVLP